MNLYARLAYLAESQVDKVAVESAGRRLTYGEFDLLARRIARRLRTAGVGAEDVVGLLLRDTPGHIAAFFAVMRIGAVILPLDWRSPPMEISRIVDRFKPKAVVCDDDPGADWLTANIGLSGIDDVEPDGEAPADVVDKPMTFSLTSGTTGEPKAMVVTHEQMLARSMLRVVSGVVARDDRSLLAMPLAYSFGRERSIGIILMGATVVMFPTLFEPEELVRFVNSEAITVVTLSPNMTRALLAMKGTKGTPGQWLLPNLRVFTSATDRLQPEERAEIMRRISPHMIDAYGSTGGGTIATIDNEADGSEPTAMGRCPLGADVEIVDDAGRPLPRGEIGRIRVRGPAVSTRVVGGDGREDEGFRDGWHYPGDFGRIDGRGIVHLHGRAADMIKRGGTMVPAQEVEQALCRHQSVTDAAVVGVPSAVLGQDVVAFVVARSPVAARDLIGHCRRELAPFKVPSRVEFVEALPRNPNGKVVKALLLERTSAIGAAND